MNIKTIGTRNGKDFVAVYECEHCGNTQTRKGYYDDYLIRKVVPNMQCRTCGKSRGTQGQSIKMKKSSPLVEFLKSKQANRLPVIEDFSVVIRKDVSELKGEYICRNGKRKGFRQELSFPMEGVIFIDVLSLLIRSLQREFRENE